MLNHIHHQVLFHGHIRIYMALILFPSLHNDTRKTGLFAELTLFSKLFYGMKLVIYDIKIAVICFFFSDNTCLSDFVTISNKSE